MSLNIQSRKKLADGNSIPLLGFGTYELEGAALRSAILWALDAGYRHFDSAEWYENEADVCKTIKEYLDDPTNDVTREDIFYTTKLMHNNGFEKVKEAITTSIKHAAPLGYVDLYLIHGPWGGPEMRKQAWNAIVDYQRSHEHGSHLLRSIGVSTYGLKHLREFETMVFDHGSVQGQKAPWPAVHQIDLHPFMTRPRIVAFCENRPLPPPTEHELEREGSSAQQKSTSVETRDQIALEAWAPLARGGLFNVPASASQVEREDGQLLGELSEKYKKTTAQILLRWSLQRGFIAIPKSGSEARIRANCDIYDFQISGQDMDLLTSRDRYYTTDWDPAYDP